ncbi:MAG: LysR family transcriptional regulator [Planctomycetaceae bacterium]|nr:LysR family transcriptional regulator [Planctomycetaceae bacterium]
MDTAVPPIPLDLLQTFVQVVRCGGNAAEAAGELQISQPTMSKRLSALRRLTSEPVGEPWLMLVGKRWKLTEEGQRVVNAVTDVVQRYDQLHSFVAASCDERPAITIACGQHAAAGFVQTAVKQFLKQHSDVRLRLATPRGKARIEGVAAGIYDMAVVTDSPATIRRLARMDLQIEDLFDDHFVLAANPSAGSPWKAAWNALPSDRPVAAKNLFELPFLLPEPDSSRRRQFDHWTFKATGRVLNVVLECGGWQTIIRFAASGLGVGLVPVSALQTLPALLRTKLAVRSLRPTDFPPDAVRLITRRDIDQSQTHDNRTRHDFMRLLRAATRAG